MFDGFPCELVRDSLVGGNRAVVASRRMGAGERILASAAAGFAIERRHMATRCAWCFATRETEEDAEDDSQEGDEDGIEWQLRCERCRSAYYCSEACQAAAAPQHRLECAVLRAVDRRKQLKKEERLLARLLTSILSTLHAGARTAALPGSLRQPTLEMLLELLPDQSESAGAKKRAKQRLAASKIVLEVGGDELLSVLPVADVATLVACLERGPMNEFGLWCADGATGSAGTAYYPAGAMLNHSCVPNVAHQFEGTDLVFYTVRPVEAGEPLCFAYTLPNQQPTAVRQTLLSNSWCFACRCPRCTNSVPPQELRDYDSSCICSCGQAKIPRKCLRRTGAAAGPMEIEQLAARWAAAESVAAETVCCCNVWNMVVREVQEPG